MPTLKASLQKRLLNFKRLAFLGVGSELRADDGAGVLAAKYLAESFSKIPHKRNCKVFIGETAPENLTGEIKKFRPTHLVIIDAADFKKKPGTIRLLGPEEASGISFSTHHLPLCSLAGYFLKFFPCDIFIVGIQPACMDFGVGMSPAVQKAVRRLSRDLVKILGDCQTRENSISRF